MRLLICPNPFKGTLTAVEAAEAMARGLRKARPELELDLMPLADGGPGTLDAMKASQGGALRRLKVAGSLGKPVTAAWLDLPGKAGVLESAQVVGLTLLPPARHRPLLASTEGLGQLILAAQGAGKTKLLIGLGGTASTDGGTGLARMLGWRFLDKQGKDLLPGGGALARLHLALPPPKPYLLRGLRIEALCDVQAPLFGPRGAANVYAPQKGANASQLHALEAGLRRLAACVDPELARRPGSGAAGGLGFGLQVFAGATLVPGAARLLQLSGFARRLRSATALLTGEGCLDAQTMHGKLPAVVALTAKRSGKLCFAACGQLKLHAADLRAAGFTQVIVAPGRSRAEAARAISAALQDWAS